MSLLQPTLTGNLLWLRPLRDEDFDELYAVASDPLIWEQHPARERYKPDVFRVFFQEGMASGGAFAVIDSSTGRIIGTTRFADYDEAAGTVEIGWTLLARSHWGGAYNREMKRLLLTHAFRFVKTVVLLVGPNNLRSQKAVEKIGGIRTGTRPTGTGTENLVYEVTPATCLAGIDYP